MCMCVWLSVTIRACVREGGMCGSGGISQWGTESDVSNRVTHGQTIKPCGIIHCG